MTEQIVTLSEKRPIIRRDIDTGNMEAGFICEDGTYVKDMEIRDAIDIDAFLEKYDIEVLRSWKGRGAILCETN